jgi:menaquinol-cytochrome c reductase iron-sulfur subunit
MKNVSSFQLSRRDFIKMVTGSVGGVIGAVLGLPLIGYLLSPALKMQKKDDWISLGTLEKYPIGVPTPFMYTHTTVNGWERTASNYGVYVLRKSENELIAFSDVCTHLGCRINWHEDLKEYVCPCHDGHFAIDGKVISGPPPRPLDQYEFKVQDGEVFVHLQG